MVSWQYIAGFFDGEGCLTTSTGKYSTHNFSMCLAQAGDVGKRVLIEIQDFLSAHGVKSHISSFQPKSDRPRKIMHQLRANGAKNSIPWIKGVLPYLIVKKTIAQDYLRFSLIFPPRYGRVQRRPVSKKEKQEMTQMRLAKIPWRIICEKFKVSKMSLWRYTKSISPN